MPMGLVTQARTVVLGKLQLHGAGLGTRRLQEITGMVATMPTISRLQLIGMGRVVGESRAIGA